MIPPRYGRKCCVVVCALQARNEGWEEAGEVQYEALG